jgi:hypothetical protein
MKACRALDSCNQLRPPLHTAQLALSIIPEMEHLAERSNGLRPVLLGIVDAPYLIGQGLASLWASAPTAKLTDVGATAAMKVALKAASMEAVALYLLQASVLAEAQRQLEAANIVFAVFKGAHLREWLYPDPSVRAAGDVDILVTPADRLRAVECLMNAGFALSVQADFVSHEATLSRNGVEIDLHWHVSRPGRLRQDITNELLARRRQINGLWTLSETDEVFLMLMHPAFTKYVSSPNMRLIRVVDFLYVVRDRDVDWDAVAELLERCGVTAAGWCVLTWYQMLHPLANRMPAAFVKRIAPGPLRAWYLRWWLRNDLPTRLFHRPILIQIGMTLFFHDSVGDVWRAVTSILRARSGGRSDELVTLARNAGSSGARLRADR